MYEIKTIHSGLVVFRSTERAIAAAWLEANNEPPVFKLVKVKTEKRTEKAPSK